jgi:hypothetical protein
MADQTFVTQPTQGLLGDPLQPLTPPPATTFTPELKPEETVEGRVTGLLSKDSPLRRLAETYAIQTANKRGLADSSIAAGEGFKAEMSYATPIATADAQALQGQRQSVLSGNIQKDLYGTQAGYSSQLSKQEAEQKKALSSQETVQTATLENIRSNAEDAIKTKLAIMEIGTREKAALGQSIGELGKIFTEQVSNIQRDPNVSAENKPAAIASAESAYKANIGTMASIYGATVSWGAAGPVTTVGGTAPAAAPTPTALAPYSGSYTGTSYPQIAPGYYLVNGKLVTKAGVEQFDVQQYTSNMG